ncbi:unnamed protein product [Pedinophyceae sp. YPF-701]|nr:unnamed protein product [Pedinophyceae sp. YPF-701]
MMQGGGPGLGGSLWDQEEWPGAEKDPGSVWSHEVWQDEENEELAKKSLVEYVMLFEHTRDEATALVASAWSTSPRVTLHENLYRDSKLQDSMRRCKGVPAPLRHLPVAHSYEKKASMRSHLDAEQWHFMRVLDAEGLVPRATGPELASPLQGVLAVYFSALDHLKGTNEEREQFWIPESVFRFIIELVTR